MFSPGQQIQARPLPTSQYAQPQQAAPVQPPATPPNGNPGIVSPAQQNPAQPPQPAPPQQGGGQSGMTPGNQQAVAQALQGGQQGQQGQSPYHRWVAAGRPNSGLLAGIFHAYEKSRPPQGGTGGAPQQGGTGGLPLPTGQQGSSGNNGFVGNMMRAIMARQQGV